MAEEEGLSSRTSKIRGRSVAFFSIQKFVLPHLLTLSFISTFPLWKSYFNAPEILRTIISRKFRTRETRSAGVDLENLSIVGVQVGLFSEEMVVLNVQRDCLDSCNIVSAKITQEDIVSTKITQEEMANTKITQEDGMVRYPTLSDLSVTSRSTRALISWANSWVLPQIWECCEKGEVPIVFFKPRAGGRVWRARELQREVRQPWAARLGRQRCAHWGGRPGTVHAVCSFRQDVRWAVYIIIFYSLFVHKGKEPCYTKCSGRN